MTYGWLTQAPIAHRGLHDASKGVIENTPSSVEAAIAAGCGIEVDLQVTTDGEAMMHHDDALGRLTEGEGQLRQMDARTLAQVPYRATADRMITLSQLCELVAGRATLVLELKSHFDGDLALVKRTAEVLSHYPGAVAVMSFDPDQIAHLRAIAPHITRGMVAERRYDDAEWRSLPASTRFSLAWMAHVPRTRPQFIAYSVADLPSAVPFLARLLFGLPLLTWTVRSDEQRRRARRWADQIIFEGAQVLETNALPRRC